MKKSIVILTMIVISGLTYAAVTDPNILNASFEDPAIDAVDNPSSLYSLINDWYHQDIYCGTRDEVYSMAAETPYGDNWAELGGEGYMYQNVSAYTPNTAYEISFLACKRTDKDPANLIVSLWAGGDEGLAGIDVPIANTNAVMVGVSEPIYVDHNAAQEKVTTVVMGPAPAGISEGDPLWLQIQLDGASRLFVDDIVMLPGTDTYLIKPVDGASGLPETTDADALDDSNVTLAWVGPATYDGATFNVYFGDTEPNLANPAPYGLSPIATATPETSVDPSPLSDLAKETTYYWVVDTLEPNTVPILHQGQAWSFTTIPNDQAPIVDAGSSYYTWLENLPQLLSGTVDDREEGDMTGNAVVSWTVTETPNPDWFAINIPNPNVLITDTTVDMLNPTASFDISSADPNVLGEYTITLTAADRSDDGTTALIDTDTLVINVSADACQAWQVSNPGGAEFDFIPADNPNRGGNGDCKVDLADLLGFASQWLDNTLLTGPYGYIE